MPVLVTAQSGMSVTDGSMELADGVLTHSQVQLTGQRPNLQIHKDLEPLQLHSLQTLAIRQRNAHGGHILRVGTLPWQPLNLPIQPLSIPELTGPGIQALTNPTDTPRGVCSVTVGWAFNARDALCSPRVKTATLDLVDLCNIATALPLPAGALELLQTKQPFGHIDDLNISWQHDISR